MEQQKQNQINNETNKPRNQGIDARSISNIRMMSGRFSSDIRIVPEIATPSSAPTYGLSVMPETSNAGLARNLVSSPRNPVMVQTAKFKFLVLGAAFVGKSSMLRRLNDPYHLLSVKNYAPTTGPDLHRLHCGTIEAIDIGGQERFRQIARLYCDLHDSFMVVFDITNLKSFETAREWLEYLHNQPKSDLMKEDKGPLNLVLVGNKKDMADKRAVSANLAKNLAMVYQAPYIEVSTKFDLTLDPVIKFLKPKNNLRNI